MKPNKRTRLFKYPSTPLALTPSQKWYDYYLYNAAHLLPIPWEKGAGVTPDELSKLARSLQAWQLGETSDGSHLLRNAVLYARAQGDPMFVKAVRLFIKEEQRHGEMLGQFLDLAGVPRVKKNWGDSCFRAIRYAMASMELWATTVIMVETLATIYYRAVKDATHSEVLTTICRQILRDEAKHLRFQYERLAIIHRERHPLLRKCTYFAQHGLFLGVTLAVWTGHHKALRAGGHSFISFMRTAFRKMGFAWKRMKPENYLWDIEGRAHDLSIVSQTAKAA